MMNDIDGYPDYCSAWGGQVEIGIKNLKAVQETCSMPAIIPKNVSYQEAVVAYLACVAKKGINRVGVKEGEVFLVTGMGNVGLSAVQFAKLKGAKVIAMDIHESRLKLAAKYTKFLINSSKQDPVKALAEFTNGKLADVVFECSGDSAIVGELYKFLREGGWGRNDEGARVHLQGDYPERITIFPYENWLPKNANVSITCALRPGTKEEVLDLISKGKFDAKSLYTKEYNIDDAPDAYKDLKKNRYDILKILFKW
jgi:threonine dehydrogenase-like Zn-dependent dehydrogenase